MLLLFTLFSHVVFPCLAFFQFIVFPVWQGLNYLHCVAALYGLWIFSSTRILPEFIQFAIDFENL